jgi:Regulator of ribonuclease activity B
MGSIFRVLERFKSDDPEVGDLKVLSALKKAGADLSKPTHFIHHLLFSDETSMMDAGRQLAEFGYRVRGQKPEETGGEYVLFVERDEVPTFENVTRMRTFMEAFADQFGGEYDDWEAAITR